MGGEGGSSFWVKKKKGGPYFFRVKGTLGVFYKRDMGFIKQGGGGKKKRGGVKDGDAVAWGGKKG